MITRSRRETVHFKHPFLIKGIDRLQAPGAYEVVTDEEMISINSADLSDARRHDASARE